MTIPPCPVASTHSGPTLGLLIRQLRDGIWERMEHELALAGHPLTFSQYVTIKKLALSTNVSVTDLARTAELNPGAMTRLLDKLEAKGLVTRVADPADRRALHIHLTEAGLKIWHDIQQCGERVLEFALTGLSHDERSQLMHLLERVRNNLLIPRG